jgi:hypothetical protein
LDPLWLPRKLRTKLGIDLAKETVRRLQIAVGLWIPRKLRPPKIHQPRIRRACIGELVQIDGCEHHWFEDRAPACTALVYIDDATSRRMHILFTGTESTFGYFEATRQYLAQHGKPLAFYSDKASIFRVNHASATAGDGHTQFGRALYELNIDGICANTPAAKGRVERAHLTMQDRLVKELRLESISTIEAANAFMPTYVPAYNALFAKVPRETHDAHRPIRATAHRSDGIRVPWKKLAGTKTQRELNQQDVEQALSSKLRKIPKRKSQLSSRMICSVPACPDCNGLR